MKIINHTLVSTIFICILFLGSSCSKEQLEEFKNGSSNAAKGCTDEDITCEESSETPDYSDPATKPAEEVAKECVKDKPEDGKIFKDTPEVKEDCAEESTETKGLWGNYQTPTILSDKPLNFDDDLDFANLTTAIDRQLRAFRNGSLKGTMQLGDKAYTPKHLYKSLQSMRELVQDAKRCLWYYWSAKDSVFGKDLRKFCVKTFSDSINENFNIYKPHLVAGDEGYNKKKPAFYTAYYSPELEASTVRSDEFPLAIYARPKEYKLRRLTRNQIDLDGDLQGHGYELFYVKSIYDLFLLHVEGGGRVKLTHPDDSVTFHYISYAGTNDRTFRFIVHYMVKEGMLGADRSITAQRKYIKEHPEDWRAIFNSCPSYVFFKVTKTPPYGIDNIPLTDLRSVALDRKYYKKSGLLTFIESTLPHFTNPLDLEDYPKYRKFSRFFMHQDTGGAIRGKARGDLYFGLGRTAERIAEAMVKRGTLYFLVLKDEQ